MDPRNTNKMNTSPGSPGVASDHVMVNTQEQNSDKASISNNPAMTSNPLPVNLYETLLLKLVAVLQLTHQNEGTTTPAAKQTILQAVSTEDLKEVTSLIYLWADK